MKDPTSKERDRKVLFFTGYISNVKAASRGVNTTGPCKKASLRPIQLGLEAGGFDGYRHRLGAAVLPIPTVASFKGSDKGAGCPLLSAFDRVAGPGVFGIRRFAVHIHRHRGGCLPVEGQAFTSPEVRFDLCTLAGSKRYRECVATHGAITCQIGRASCRER